MTKTRDELITRILEVVDHVGIAKLLKNLKTDVLIQYIPEDERNEFIETPQEDETGEDCTTLQFYKLASAMRFEFAEAVIKRFGINYPTLVEVVSNKDFLLYSEEYNTLDVEIINDAEIIEIYKFGWNKDDNGNDTIEFRDVYNDLPFKDYFYFYGKRIPFFVDYQSMD